MAASGSGRAPDGRNPIITIRNSLVEVEQKLGDNEFPAAQRQIKKIGQLFAQADRTGPDGCDAIELIELRKRYDICREILFPDTASHSSESARSTESAREPILAGPSGDFVDALKEDSFAPQAPGREGQIRMLKGDVAGKLQEVVSEAPSDSFKAIFDRINEVRPVSEAHDAEGLTVLNSPVSFAEYGADTPEINEWKQLMSLSYDGILKVRGDGDCLLRAVYTSLIAQGSGDVLKRVEGLEDQAFGPEVLEEMFENPTSRLDEKVCDALRVAIARTIRDDETGSYAIPGEYISEALQRKHSLQEPHINALAQTLGIRINRVDYASDSADAYSQDRETTVSVLYNAPDSHFDLLVKSKDRPRVRFDYIGFKSAVEEAKRAETQEDAKRKLDTAYGILNAYIPLGKIYSYQSCAYRRMFEKMQEERSSLERRLGCDLASCSKAVLQVEPATRFEAGVALPDSVDVSKLHSVNRVEITHFEMIQSLLINISTPNRTIPQRRIEESYMILCKPLEVDRGTMPPEDARFVVHKRFVEDSLRRRGLWDLYLRRDFANLAKRVYPPRPTS